MKYILAARALLPEPDLGSNTKDLFCPNLDVLEKQILSQRIRRAGHVSRMAYIGAAACLKHFNGKDIPKERLGVFHGTALGNLKETRVVFHQVLREPEGLPSPIQFSNSIDNMSSFFIAGLTGAQGPNMVISQEEFSFEGALLSALLAGEVGEIDFALVGGTDGFFGPREEHLRCLEYPPETKLGEGTGWLLLGRNPSEAFGEIVHVEHFLNCDNNDPKHEMPPLSQIILDRIWEHQRGKEAVWILPGMRTEPFEIETILKKLPSAHMNEYLNKTGIYPTAVANGMADIILTSHEEGLYVHIARNNMDRAAVTIFRLKHS